MSSSVIADFQVNGLFPSNVGGTGTAIKYFPRILGSSIGVQSVAPSATSAAGQLVVPANGELNGQLFKVKAAGNVLPFTGGGTYNVVLYANTGTVATPSYTAIASTGAITLAQTTRSNWALDVTLVGDTVSGQVGGNYSATTNNANNKAQVPLDAFLTGVNFNAGQSSPAGNGIAFGLAVGVTFSVSLASNAASLYQFQIIS